MDFNRDRMEGQMLPEERKALYDIIVETKPDIVFEVGTWKGGGSTFFIASALAENKKGRLFTIECDGELFRYAKALYATSLASLRPYVFFNKGESDLVYPKILSEVENVDFVFLDGKEDPEQTVKEYNMFLPHMKAGSYLACHDWKISKMEKLKVILSDCTKWKSILEITHTDTGFAIFKKL